MSRVARYAPPAGNSPRSTRLRNSSSRSPSGRRVHRAKTRSVPAGGVNSTSRTCRLSPPGSSTAASDTSSHGVCSTMSSLVIRHSTTAALLAITAPPR